MLFPSLAALPKRLILSALFSSFCLSVGAQSVTPTPSSKEQAKPVQAKTSLARAVKTKLPSSRVQGLLFEITQADAEKSAKKSYLFASIHVAKADFYPLSLPVQNAYHQADTVAVEADSSDEAANRNMVAKLSYVAPDRLQAHISPVTWDLLQSMTGSAVEQFQTYTPIMVAMGLTVSVGMQLGYDPAQSLDLHFINASKKDKKPLLELEGLEFQAGVLASLSDEEGNATLSNTLNSFRQGAVAKELNRIATAWKAADAQGLAKILMDAGNRDEGAKKLMKSLMEERNAGIAEKILEQIRAGKSLFAVVAAGHLAGENNLIEALQRQGLQVKQIK